MENYCMGDAYRAAREAREQLPKSIIYVQEDGRVVAYPTDMIIQPFSK